MIWTLSVSNRSRGAGHRRAYAKEGKVDCHDHECDDECDSGHAGAENGTDGAWDEGEEECKLYYISV